MSNLYDMQDTALRLMFEANLKLREQIQNHFSSPESTPEELRDFCTLRFEIGQRSGKSTWVEKTREPDWVVLDYGGCDDNSLQVNNRVQYLEALTKAKHARVIVLNAATYMLHAFDPRGTDLFKILSSETVKGRTILLLG
jgi:hypothetical protein